METRFESFAITVIRLNKLVQKIKLHEMKSHGLKAIHVMCIYYLSQNPKGLTASELSRLTLEDKAAISRALPVLEEKGYIQLRGNKYGASILLTKDGKEVAQNIVERADRATRACGVSLTDEERTQFFQVLSGVADNMQAYYQKLLEQSNETGDSVC